VRPPVVVLGLVGAAGGGALTVSAAAHVPDNAPIAAATSTCSFDGSGFWWMRLASPALFYSPNTTAPAAADLSGAAGGWPAAAQPAACAVAGGALFVAVAGAPNASAVTVYAAAPALPVAAAGLAWAAVAALAVPAGAGAGGLALSPDGRALFLVAAGGVQRATRAAGGAAPFGAFAPNAAAAAFGPSDVVVSANGLALYVLSPAALAVVDLRAPWATAPLVNVTTAANDGSTFLGLAIAPR